MSAVTPESSVEPSDGELWYELKDRLQEIQEYTEVVNELHKYKEEGGYDDIDKHLQNAEKTYETCNERIDELFDLLEERGINATELITFTPFTPEEEQRIRQFEGSEASIKAERKRKYEEYQEDMTEEQKNTLFVLEDGADMPDHDTTETKMEYYLTDCHTPQKIVHLHEWMKLKLHSHLLQYLKHHQIDAAKAASYLLFNAKTGYMIAHEMGLGKTLSAIAVISFIFDNSPTATILVTCPLSVMENWYNELAMWSKQCHLSFTYSLPLNKYNSDAVRKWKNTGGVLIVGHDNFSSNYSKYTPDYLIIDEAHLCKNKKTKLYQASFNSTKARLLLTGTPLQNNLSEFYAMITLLNPTLIDENSFRKQYKVPIEKALLMGASEEEKALGRTLMEILSKITKDIMHRKTISLLKASLPDCREFKLTYTVPDGFNKQVEENIRKRRESNYDNDDEGIKLNGYELALNYETMVLSKEEKLKAVKMLLDAYKDQKVLIFTPSLDVLKYFSEHIGGYVMDGKTPVDNRYKMVKEFQGDNSKYTTMFMTTKVGGVGLNLTAASVVIIADPSWNPAADKQASFRAYRFGQHKPVTIIRLIANNTIQTKLYNQAAHKDLCSSRIVDSRDVDRQFTADQIKNKYGEDSNEQVLSTTTDSCLNKVLQHFYSCTDRSVLFETGLGESLTIEEEAEASNSFNKIMAKQEFRNYETKDGKKMRILSKQLVVDDIPGLLNPMTPYYEFSEEYECYTWVFGTEYKYATSYEAEFSKHKGRVRMFDGHITKFPAKETNGCQVRYRVIAQNLGDKTNWSEWSAVFYEKK